MENIEIFKELINDNDIKYFYHVTNQDCESIIDEGFYMIDQHLYKTMIEVPIELKNDPIKYAENEKGMKGSYRENGNIIIFGIDKEETDYFVRECNYVPTTWDNDLPPNYYISTEYIVGYINTIEKTFIPNYEYKYNDIPYL